LSDASPEPAIARLRAALDNLEAAVERRARRDGVRSDAAAEFAMMQDDRARLAVELDAALDAQRALAEANTAAMERITRAAGTIERWLTRASA
jgi:hypothetical protein